MQAIIDGKRGKELEAEIIKVLAGSETVKKAPIRGDGFVIVQESRESAKGE